MAERGRRTAAKAAKCSGCNSQMDNAEQLIDGRCYECRKARTEAADLRRVRRFDCPVCGGPQATAEADVMCRDCQRRLRY